MGWDYVYPRRPMSVAEHRRRHEEECNSFGDTLVECQWFPGAFYAIIYTTREDNGPPHHYFRVDLIDCGGSGFGWKGMDESAGPYVDFKPSAKFAETLLRLIPDPPNEWARKFRERIGLSPSLFPR